jgi:CheY-like chemotaxis protein
MAKKYKLVFAEDTGVWDEKVDEIAEGYPCIKIMHVSTGEEALDEIKDGVNILITDDKFNLSGGSLNGLQVTKKIRDKEGKRGKQLNHTYIVIYSDILTRAEAIKAGANLIVQKGDNLLNYAIKRAVEAIKAR